MIPNTTTIQDSDAAYGPELHPQSDLLYFFRENASAMWIFDRETLAFLEVNNTALHIYGYTRDEFLKMSLLQIRPEKENELLKAFLQQSPDATQKRAGTWQHQKADGSLIWVDIVSFPVIFKGRKAKLVTARDISPEKEVRDTAMFMGAMEPEAGAREAMIPGGVAKYLATATLITSNKVLFLDADGHIEWVNEAFTALYGYTLEEVSGKKPDLLHGPLSDSKTTARIRMAVIQGKTFKEEVVHYTKEGEERWMLAAGQPLANREGNVEKYLVVHTDITGLKQKEAKVQQSALRLETLMNTTNSPHLFFDKHLRLQAYNKAACELAKQAGVVLRRGETLDHITRLVTGEDFSGYCRLALSGINTLNREVEMIPGKLWLLVSYVAARDCFGNIPGITFYALDITARKLSENKLQKQGQVLNEIAWKQSHLVRAPLANMLCIVNLLQLDSGDQTLLHHLKKESERLDKVIRDIVLQSSNI